MTDLEITRLCAAAMGIPTWEEASGGPEILYLDVRVSTGVKYRPLHDDAQAMALMKKFKLGLAFSGHWSVYEQGDGESGHAADLNRAICECVAKIRGDGEPSQPG